MNPLSRHISPRRLRCQQGDWELEVERLVPVGRVLQPSTQRIQGASLILMHLEILGDGEPLAEAAAALIRTGEDDVDQEFEPWDGRWLPRDLVELLRERRPAQIDGAPAAGASEAELGWLRSSLASVRKNHELLAERVARAEGGSDLGGQVESLANVLEKVVARLDRLEQRLDAGAAPADPARDASRSAADAADAAAAGDDAADGDGEASAAAAPPELDLGLSGPTVPPDGVVRVQPPSLAQMEECLTELLGRPVTLKPARGGVLADASLHVSRLVDDGGEVVGAMIADVEAVVGLGGALLSLPEEEQDAQRASRSPSQDVLDAMSEVFNAASATVNAVEDNPHVRVHVLEPVDPAALPWLDDASHRVDMSVDGSGVITIVGR